MTALGSNPAAALRDTLEPLPRALGKDAATSLTVGQVWRRAHGVTGSALARSIAGVCELTSEIGQQVTVHHPGRISTSRRICDRVEEAMLLVPSAPFGEWWGAVGADTTIEALDLLAGLLDVSDERRLQILDVDRLRTRVSDLIVEVRSDDAELDAGLRDRVLDLLGQMVNELDGKRLSTTTRFGVLGELLIWQSGDPESLRKLLTSDSGEAVVAFTLALHRAGIGRMTSAPFADGNEVPQPDPDVTECVVTKFKVEFPALGPGSTPAALPTGDR